ncbi:hypothetical protein NDI54_00820 [Haloarcula sp. S1AR25-5A]|uniref:Uncharacterized protein n=1 Tax=Haloarcula terrestris TaxID=2950533 RepID=A0AAE4EUV0_9EURY|nr:hypothetical protein [Haloarcula terrestris]MDS0219894.1 hypothetical protein [Haloarcula terrestris]
MSTDGQAYVIAPWGEGECETTVVTVDLPSRDLTVQLEVPTTVLDRMAQLSDEHDIPVAQVLGERLEISRARISIRAAKSVEDVAAVQQHLTDAREYLSGVEVLDTADLEDDIEQLWTDELGSA